MTKLYDFFKRALLTFRRIFIGKTVQQVDTSIVGGLGVLSILLKRDRRSGEEYMVLNARASSTTMYYAFDLNEFDRFIETADRILSARTSEIVPSKGTRTLDEYSEMVLTGSIVRQIDTEAGGIPMSFQLKRAKDDHREYVVFAATTPGIWMYYPFELDDFHRFVHNAKKICAASSSASANR